MAAQEPQDTGGINPDEILQLFQYKPVTDNVPGLFQGLASGQVPAELAGITDTAADKASAAQADAKKMAGNDPSARTKGSPAPSALPPGGGSFLFPDQSAKPPSIEEAMGLWQSGRDVAANPTAPRYGLDVPAQRVMPPAMPGEQPHPSSIVAAQPPEEAPAKTRPMWIANDDMSKMAAVPPGPGKSPVVSSGPGRPSPAPTPEPSPTPAPSKSQDAQDFIKEMFKSYRQGRLPNFWDILQAVGGGLGGVTTPTEIQVERSRDFETQKDQRNAQLEAKMAEIANQYASGRMTQEKDLEWRNTMRQLQLYIQHPELRLGGSFYTQNPTGKW